MASRRQNRPPYRACDIYVWARNDRLHLLKLRIITSQALGPLSPLTTTAKLAMEATPPPAPLFPLAPPIPSQEQRCANAWLRRSVGTPRRTTVVEKAAAAVVDNPCVCGCPPSSSHRTTPRHVHRTLHALEQLTCLLPKLMLTPNPDISPQTSSAGILANTTRMNPKARSRGCRSTPAAALKC